MSTPEISRGASALSAFGFSEIEALVYCFLLTESPATGYRVSHAIGKPTANTYKAIAALAARGALSVDDGDSRLYRAVPPEELLAGLERGFQAHRAAAREALKDLHHPASDDRIYHLSTVDQVLGRATSMLDRATRHILVDGVPDLPKALRDPLRAAVKRGVEVVLQTCEPTRLAGALLLQSPLGPETAAHWPGRQLSLVVDAQEHLLALMDLPMGLVHQAVWSQSPFLSCMQHNHLACEFTLTALETLPAGDPRRARIQAMSLLRAMPEGLGALRRNLGLEGEGSGERA